MQEREYESHAYNGRLYKEDNVINHPGLVRPLLKALFLLLSATLIILS